MDKKSVAPPISPDTPAPPTIEGRLDLFIKVMETKAYFGSNQALAEGLGMAAQNLSKYKLPDDPTKPSATSRRLPSVETLARFAEIGLSMDWLFRGGAISGMIYGAAPSPVTPPPPAMLAELNRAQVHAEAALESIRRALQAEQA